MLAQLSALINENKTDEAKKYFSEVINPSFKSFSSYDTSFILLDNKYSSFIPDKDSLERLTIHKDINHQNCNSKVEKLIPLINKLPIKQEWKIPSQKIKDYNATNPSIIVNPDNSDEYILNVRHVNYHCDEKNQYHCNNSKETIVHTKNIIYICDKDKFDEPKKTILLTDNTEFIKYPSPVQDLEDIRLVVRNTNEIWCSATSREYLPSTTPQIILSEIKWPQKQINYGLRLIAHDPQLTEIVQKNWLPFMDKSSNQLRFIYSFGPKMIIYGIDEFTGKCFVDKSYDTYLSFQQARGGSSPIPFSIKGTNVAFICSVHFAFDKTDIRRKYFHRFIMLDQHYKPLFITESWYLLDPHSIEFVISACVASPESIYLGVGHNDVEAYIMEINNSDIEALKRYSI